MPVSRENYQTVFHRRWSRLSDPHVRALAWLLDAPDLLDGSATGWKGRIASLGPITTETENWLHQLDQDPASLHAWLGAPPMKRLGRYAEKLMAFHFRQQGILVAHGLQVKGANNETVGEFDFLLRRGGDLVHWEFASKFYLLESSEAAQQPDFYVGPNLADTLGLKLRKIMERQLALSAHPAARLQLPEPVASAQALVKGWLFYYRHSFPPARLPGLSAPHCQGFWCELAALEHVAGDQFLVLPRLSWLAPARAVDYLTKDELLTELMQRFKVEVAPVLVAVLAPVDSYWIEVDRGFIVPDGWRDRAEERISRMMTAG